MEYSKQVSDIKLSIAQQEEIFKKTLILNPVENIPTSEILLPAVSFMHGLYNTDKVRTDEQKMQTKIQFSGRDAMSSDLQNIYSMWANLLGAEKATLRLLSGLHAHTVIFMCITQIGDKVMLLPEAAGGHMATKSILERLGLEVIDFCVDYDNLRIDKEATIRKIKEEKPKVIFFDRSEGLLYEDLSWLKEFDDIYKIFDGSQYLTNIIAKDYINPFDMGFDAILSTLHKNLPGPQRALYATKKDDDMWKLIYNNIGTYVSNMHVFSIYSAGLLLDDIEKLNRLSNNMLENTLLLEKLLCENGISVIKRASNDIEKHTHHIWIQCKSKTEAFDFYLKLESVGIMVNYRKLPYELGYGLRLGLSGATQSGLCPKHIDKLASYIGFVYKNDVTLDIINEIGEFIESIKG